MSLARTLRSSPREIAGRIAASPRFAADLLGRGRGARLHQHPCRRPSGIARRSPRCCPRAIASAPALPPSPSGSRSSTSAETPPGRSPPRPRATRPTVTRSPACSRLPATTSSASTTSTTPAGRWICSAPRCGRVHAVRNRREDGYQGAYIKEIADRLGLEPDAPADEWRERGVEVMIAEIKTTLARFRATFDSWFLERSLYEDGSVDRAIARLRRAGTRSETRARCGCARPSSETIAIGCWCARTAIPRTSPATSPTSSISSSGASTSPCTCSGPTITGMSAGSRPRPARSATTPTGSTPRSTSS